VGASISLPLVWNLSDISNGLMAFPNLVALIGLSGVVARLLRDYENRRPTMTPYRPYLFKRSSVGTTGTVRS
jgi:AGCS family alanine or glycine:cation symporter